MNEQNKIDEINKNLINVRKDLNELEGRINENLNQNETLYLNQIEKNSDIKISLNDFKNTFHELSTSITSLKRSTEENKDKVKDQMDELENITHAMNILTKVKVYKDNENNLDFLSTFINSNKELLKINYINQHQKSLSENNNNNSRSKRKIK